MIEKSDRHSRITVHFGLRNYHRINYICMFQQLPISSRTDIISVKIFFERNKTATILAVTLKRSGRSIRSNYFYRLKLAVRCRVAADLR